MAEAMGQSIVQLDLAATRWKHLGMPVIEPGLLTFDIPLPELPFI